MLSLHLQTSVLSFSYHETIQNRFQNASFLEPLFCSKVACSSFSAWALPGRGGRLHLCRLGSTRGPFGQIWGRFGLDFWSDFGSTHSILNISASFFGSTWGRSKVDPSRFFDIDLESDNRADPGSLRRVSNIFFNFIIYLPDDQLIPIARTLILIRFPSCSPSLPLLISHFLPSLLPKQRNKRT